MAIRWDDVGWCIEATGSKPGDTISLNSCSGAQRQKWIWIPDGCGQHVIHLKDTELCLDAIDIGVDSKGVPIELRVCGRNVAKWQFDEPFPLVGISPGDNLSYQAQHVMITLLTLVGVGAASLS